MRPVPQARNGGSSAKGGRNAPTLPPQLAALFNMLPAYPGALMLVAGLNLALRSQLPQDVRDSLEGKHLRLRISDAGLGFNFGWRGRHFVALRRGATPDLEIAALARDLLALARREEDPDTLFFCRRLNMEGDTELGLLVKNTLDAIDAPLPELGRQALQNWLRGLPGLGR